MSDGAFERHIAPFTLIPRESTVDRIVREADQAERNYVEPEEDNWVLSPREQQIYEQETANLRRTHGTAQPMWVEESIGLSLRQPTFATAVTQEQPWRQEQDQAVL